MNGLLPLRNIRVPDVLVTSKELLPIRKRRRRTGSSDYCRTENFRDFVLNISSNEASGSKEAYSAAPKPQAYVYAITQDCQIIFARAEQMHQIGKMVEVDNRLTYCLPGLVQLHWRETETGGIGLQLLLKRTTDRFAPYLYSLRSSLNYAVCSFMSNSSFVMEPELSFMDTTYSDVVYFVDPSSSGAYWTVRQFKLDERGYFKALDTFITPTHWKAAKSCRIFILLDAQRKKFFAVHKQRKSVVSTCAYDLLFRPHRAKVERSYLVPFETVSKTNRPANTLIKATTSNQSSPNCVLGVPFRAKFGFITTQSLEQLNEIQLPKFSAAQMKSHKSSKSKDRSTTTTVSPKHKPRHQSYSRESSSAALIRDQLLPSTSSKPLLPPTTMSSILRGKSSITTIKLVRPTTTATSKSSHTTRRPATTRSRFQAKSAEGSGFNTNSEEGQLLTPTSFKEIEQKAGYSDYETVKKIMDSMVVVTILWVY
uniref:Uncharacterized protein n=1 Tax=Ditylenchus dipsaci TaxID=166011 RepID=A0A915D5A8_9BILA